MNTTLTFTATQLYKLMIEMGSIQDTTTTGLIEYKTEGIIKMLEHKTEGIIKTLEHKTEATIKTLENKTEAIATDSKEETAVALEGNFRL